MARKSSNPRFETEREYVFDALEGGLPASLFYWYNQKHGGEPREVELEYRVLTKRGPVAIVTYDGAREFWRRGPRWPQPGERTQSFGETPLKQRKDVALDDINENARRFEAVVPADERGE